MDRVKIDLSKKEDIERFRHLKPRTMVLLSGTIYTARDQAHRRLESDFKKGRLPIGLRDKIVYYCGPTLPKKGRPIGSCGPTTSSRMDKYVNLTVSLGLLGVIGKGERSEDVLLTLSRSGVRYLVAPGGAGAYLSTKVKASRIVLYPDLGPEAIRELEVQDFPALIW